MVDATPSSPLLCISRPSVPPRLQIFDAAAPEGPPADVEAPLAFPGACNDPRACGDDYAQSRRVAARAAHVRTNDGGI